MSAPRARRHHPRCGPLAAAGAELVRGDLDRVCLDAAVRGAYGVYSVQAANGREVVQGTAIADAAKAADVQHLVYSSVGGVESQNRFYVEHGWGAIDKWQIEEHIRNLGIPATILRPAGFMEDFTSPARFFVDGTLSVPWRDDLVMQLIAIDDIGAFAALAFATRTIPGTAMEIAGDKLTAPQIADAFTKAVGRPCRTSGSRSRSCGNTAPRPPRCSPGRTRATSTPTSSRCDRRSETLWTSTTGSDAPGPSDSWPSCACRRPDLHRQAGQERH